MAFFFFPFCLLLYIFGRVRSAPTTLGGHYNFTIIHEPPYVDVGISDGIILPKEQWKGYIVDMIRIIARKAGFSYTLFLPSGHGSSCPSGATDMELSTSYLCGQQDTLELNMTHAYWSQYYVTKIRVEAGTSFTTPFLTGVGLGLLVLPSEPSTVESFLLLFSPFSWEMWVMTVGVCVFAAVVVWLTEVVEAPSRSAYKTVNYLTTTVYRKTDLSQIEQFFLDDGNGMGLFDLKSYIRFPLYILGTFSGLMNASDDSEKDEGRVTPSGPFAAAWCFFVLFWASAYTANLAATLTTSHARTSFNNIDDLARIGSNICASANAAYTEDLIATYPSLNVKTYTSIPEMVRALQAKECMAMIESYAALNGIANGVTDLDDTSGRNFCKVQEKMILAGKPLATGFTDMAVGVSSQYSLLRDVINYWIIALRTCSPSDNNGECPRSGIGGGINLELLRQQHVEQANCGNAHLGDSGAIVLGITNFFFPIAAVGTAGVIMIVYYASIYVMNMYPYLLSDNIESILSADAFGDCFRKLDEGRRALMLHQMFSIIQMPEHEHFRAKLIKAAARHYLLHDLKSFFAIVRLGHIIYPGTLYGDNTPKDTTHLRTAGKVASEVEASVDILIVRAISQTYHDNGTVENFTFVCRDDAQYEIMNKAGWGEKTMFTELDDVEFYTKDDDNDIGDERRNSEVSSGRISFSGNGKKQRPSMEMIMKDKVTVPYV